MIDAEWKVKSAESIPICFGRENEVESFCYHEMCITIPVPYECNLGRFSRPNTLPHSSAMMLKQKSMYGVDVKALATVQLLGFDTQVPSKGEALCFLENVNDVCLYKADC